jgi:hypothetical protein
MTTKAKQDAHRTPKAGIKPTAEISTLTPQERAEFIDTPEPAQARSETADFAEYEPVTFEDWFLDIDRDIKRGGRA